MTSPLRLLTHNFGLKMLALLLAVMLWHQVTSQRTVQRTLTIPLAFVNVPRGLEISNDHPTNVDVTVRSERGAAPLEEKVMTAVVDLKDTAPGVSVVNLAETNVSRPAGVYIISINPARIRLQLEQTRQKIIKIEPQISGQPAEGYEVTSVTVLPTDVLISGPESNVQTATSAQTGTIDIEGRTSTMAQTVFVDLEDPRLRIEEPLSVNIVVTIEEKRRPVRVKGVAVVVEPEGVKHRLYNRTVDLEGSVPISFKESLQAESFKAVVDLANLPAQTEPHLVPPLVVIPAEYEKLFRLARTQPVEVKVRKNP